MRRYGLCAGLAASILVLSEATRVIAQPLDNDPLGRDTYSSTSTVAPPVVWTKSSASVQAIQTARRGNPLWEIPIKSLIATRERPIFSPSRRPPPPVAVVASYVPPRSPAKPANPQLTLLGTVLGAADEGDYVNSADGIGVFLDQASNAVVRLKTGDYHNGWLLGSVRGREATLQNDHDTVVLTLPARGTEQVLVRPANANISAIQQEPESLGTPSLRLLFKQYH